jgi:hypothetical protein
MANGKWQRANGKWIPGERWRWHLDFPGRKQMARKRGRQKVDGKERGKQFEFCHLLFAV